LFSTARVVFITLFVALLALSGCQTPPPKGLSPAQVAVLKQQGFELTDDGWAFGLSGKVLFGSDVESLQRPQHGNRRAHRQGVAGRGHRPRAGRRPHRRLGQREL